MLDLAVDQGLPLSNMALQKLLYYAHGWTLAAANQLLIRGGFQAWEFGPVSRTVYTAFKSTGEKPILTRAMVIDITSGEEIRATANIDEEDSDLMANVLSALGHLHPYELSRRTHEPGSPWHQIWTAASVVPGMQIPDELIREHFLDPRFATRN